MDLVALTLSGTVCLGLITIELVPVAGLMLLLGMVSWLARGVADSSYRHSFPLYGPERTSLLTAAFDHTCEFSSISYSLHLHASVCSAP